MVVPLNASRAVLVLVVLGAPVPVEAQRVNIAAVGGWMVYDAGGDQTYTTVGLQVRYPLSKALRVGIATATAHIGDPLRSWAGPGTDERIWRVSAMGELATKPFHKSSLAARGMLGVFHSSGVIYQEPPPDIAPYSRITDTNTGVTYGAGIGFEVGPYSGIRFYLQGNYWRDHAYGAVLDNPELLGGVGLDL